MKRLFLRLAIISVLFCAIGSSFAQEDAAERILVLKKAQERQDNTAVAVEAYLLGDILEVTVTARMYGTKPKIYNTVLVGPKISRLSPQEKQTVYPKAEDKETTFLTEDVEPGLIRLGSKKRVQEKKLKGTLTKELYRFKIPTDKIMPGKRYELRIQVESMQESIERDRFTFELKDFPKLLLQQK